MNIKLHIGFDVHKNSIVVATAKADGTEPQSFGKWGGSNLSAERGLLKLRKSFGVDKSEISIVYEAGPSGFVLARRLQQIGYHCIIVGPSEVCVICLSLKTCPLKQQFTQPPDGSIFGRGSGACGSDSSAPHHRPSSPAQRLAAGYSASEYRETQRCLLTLLPDTHTTEYH